MTDFFLRGDRWLKPGNAAVAMVVLDDGRYLMQLRSQKPGIFYPGHWGVFGGAVDEGESADAALQRELTEELGVKFDHFDYFTEFRFDFSFVGHGQMWRRYYIVTYPAKRVSDLVLGEGSAMNSFTATELLNERRVVPYDAFAIWMRESHLPR